MFGKHNPHDTKAVNGGVQELFKFDNGYGASVVCGPYTYGGDRGLWELAVLGPDDHLTYETPITNDVLGYLDPEGVAQALDQIEALTPESIAASKVEREREKKVERIASIEREIIELTAELATLRTDVQVSA